VTAIRDLHPNAAGLFRAVLPAPVLARLDLATLTGEPGSFIDDHLAATHSDLLFSVTLAGHRAFIYALLEHQSSPDELMALRLLKYMLRIWERHVEDHGRGKQALPLPFIIPIVVHHGEEGWTAATRLEGLFDQALAEELELGSLVPRLEFLLDDLTYLSDDDLRHRARGLLPVLALWALRDARYSGRAEVSVRRWLGASSTFIEPKTAGRQSRPFSAIFTRSPKFGHPDHLHHPRRTLP
jgi:hypothetical protein